MTQGRIPLFEKWFDEAHHPELAEGEGLGEILEENAWSILDSLIGS